MVHNDMDKTNTNQVYHTNNKYLNLLEKKFGINAVKNLQETTKIELKRKLYQVKNSIY